MSAPPYMKLYVADYLGDTHHLSVIEHGAYLLLLMAMWRAGGTLPSADANLAKLARCTPDQWAEIRMEVLSRFSAKAGQLRAAERYCCHTDQGPDRRAFNPRWEVLRAAVFERDSYTCTYCASTDGPLEVDHVVPCIAGGSDDLANLVCACRSCNRSKGAKGLEDWLAGR